MFAWEYINGTVGDDDWTRRARVHGGWLVQTMVQTRFGNPVVGGVSNVVRNFLETFVPDPDDCWSVELPPADTPPQGLCPECNSNPCKPGCDGIPF